MGKFIDTMQDAGLGMIPQAAQGILGIALGRAMEKHNDERQIRQQRALQDMQMQGNREMMKYGKELDYEMWKKTNYGAQMEELRKAGLNPGLLYGMGGQGGMTTGGSAPGVGSGSAPSGGGEAMGMGIQAMGMQLQLLNAQKENLEADTANKRSENPNIPLTGENIKAQTMDLLQGVQNKKAQERLTKIQGDIAELDEELKSKTLEDAIELVNIEEMSARTQLDRLARMNELEKATYDTRYQMIGVELTTMLLNNEIQRAQKKNINADTGKKIAETGVAYQTIKNLANEIVQKGMAWETAQQGANTAQRNQELEDWKATVQKTTGIGMEALDMIIDGFILKRLLGGAGHTPVSGFHKR